MIDLKIISNYFDVSLRDNPSFSKHIIKEYVQLMVLDHLSDSPYFRKLSFIGGTNLRLIKGIDRFSEDLDFDVHDMSEVEFMEMTDSVVTFLQRSGLNAEPRDRANARLSAFRRNIYFPQLLFDLQLSGHKEERFLLKIEAQNQGVPYEPRSVNVQGCGFYFPLPVPPDEILLSMKLSALLSRAKGRDFYDTMFLMSQTTPDYAFLKARAGIGTPQELKQAIREMLLTTDLKRKKQDFEHLLFNKNAAERILRFSDFISDKL